VDGDDAHLQTQELGGLPEVLDLLGGLLLARLELLARAVDQITGTFSLMHGSTSW